MKQMIIFTNIEEAQKHKQNYGGRIFKPSHGKEIKWFSPEFMPTEIFKEYTVFESGRLD